MNAFLEELNDGTKQETLTEIWEGGVRKALGLKEEDLEAALSVANAKMKAGNWQLAYRIYGFLVLCAPANFRYHQGLANFCLQTGKYDAAVEAASSMIVLKPESPLGYYISGAACLALGALTEAKEDAKDAQRLAEKQQNTRLKDECVRLHSQIAFAGRTEP